MRSCSSTVARPAGELFTDKHIVYAGKRRAGYLCASQSSDGSCLAVGTEVSDYEAMIDIWCVARLSPDSFLRATLTSAWHARRDLRTLTLQHTYTEAHSDDLTSLSFHPSPSLAHVLLSGSVDGLVNTYDVRIADEDDAVLTTAQFGASIAHAGWMALSGSAGARDAQAEHKGIYGATTIETMQFWDAEQVRSSLSRSLALSLARREPAADSHLACLVARSKTKSSTLATCATLRCSPGGPTT